ncbi:MAG: FG-GAP repeat protein [Planctomycetota bacterium]
MVARLGLLERDRFATRRAIADNDNPEETMMSMRDRVAMLAAAVSIGCCAPIAAAQLDSSQTLLPALDAEAGNPANFGSALDENAGVLTIAAPGQDDALTTDAGRVHVYERDTDGWRFIDVLKAPDPDPTHLFGQDVAVSPDGTRVVVGAMWDDDVANDAGAAYVYRRDAAQWVLEAKLLPSAGKAGGWFGVSVDIEGERVVVGAREENTSVAGTGAAYVFERIDDAWTETQRLSSESLRAQNRFGHDVKLSGDTIAVGAFNHAAPGTFESGGVFVFEHDGAQWVERQTLFGSNAGSNDFFGVSIDLEGDRLVVGARSNGGGSDGLGAVYVFERDGVWVERERLLSPLPQSSSEFGNKLDLEGDRLLVGAWQHRVRGVPAGQAFLFERLAGRWRSAATMSPPGRAVNQQFFGHDVELADGLAVVGSFQSPLTSNRSGAAFGYDVARCRACPGDTTGDSGPGVRDGAVELADFAFFMNLWATHDERADVANTGACQPCVGGDGVDLTDFSCFLNAWSAGCP